MANELRLVRLWLTFACCLSTFSTFLYFFLPEGTIEFFGGKPTPTAAFWCSTAATGDVVSAYWCLCGLRAKTSYELRQSIRGLLLFTTVHFACFIRSHYLLQPLPGGGEQYIAGWLVGLALGIRWGFWKPPRLEGDDSTTAVKAD